MAGILLLSAKKRGNKRNKPENRRIEELQLPVKSGKETEEAVKITADNTTENPYEKQPNEPFQEILTLPRTGKVSLFKSKIYKGLVSIRLNTLRMSPTSCGFDTCASPNLGRADVLDRSLLNVICRRGMPEK